VTVLLVLKTRQGKRTSLMVRSWCNHTTNGLTLATGQELRLNPSVSSTCGPVPAPSPDSSPPPIPMRPPGKGRIARAKYTFYIIALLLVAFLVSQSRTQRNQITVPSRRLLYYVDPMHPAFRSEKPGIAPDCGMQLEPVYAEEHAKAIISTAAQTEPGVVRIDTNIQQLVGIGVATVEKTFETRTLRIPGRVAADETRVYRVNAGVDGFVKETREDTVGSHVKKDQRLAVIYSPEFISAAGGYFSASQQAQVGIPKESAAGAGAQAQVGVQNWVNRLRSLGMSDAQIDELNVTRRTPDGIYVVSPVSGFILARNISPGLRFDRNMEFYRIADLSHVWVIADLLGSEDRYFGPGSIAHITLRNQNRSFSARVSNILPQVDPGTRTIKLRLEVGNQNFILRPDMLVNVDFSLGAPSGLSVPADAVVDSGLSQRVYVDRGEGTFEPRQVEVGERFGDRVQILRGLSEGEKVVASGTFLVDSESRLKSPL
jgi:Cu(I)/Ag(I) efflux system membrane fusion protein